MCDPWLGAGWMGTGANSLSKHLATAWGCDAAAVLRPVVVMFRWGSRVYGTARRESDHDFVVVVVNASTHAQGDANGADGEEEEDEVWGPWLPLVRQSHVRADEHRCGTWDDGRANVSVATLDQWYAMIWEHRHDALECVFMAPPVARDHAYVVQGERWPPAWLPAGGVDPHVLVRTCLFEAKRRFHIAKSGVEGEVQRGGCEDACVSAVVVEGVDGRYTVPARLWKSLKDVVHALRYMMFALQVMEQGEIYDPSAANHVWEEVASAGVRAAAHIPAWQLRWDALASRVASHSPHHEQLWRCRLDERAQRDATVRLRVWKRGAWCSGMPLWEADERLPMVGGDGSGSGCEGDPEERVILWSTPVGTVDDARPLCGAREKGQHRMGDRCECATRMAGPAACGDGGDGGGGGGGDLQCCVAKAMQAGATVSQLDDRLGPDCVSLWWDPAMPRYVVCREPEQRCGAGEFFWVMLHHDQDETRTLHIVATAARLWDTIEAGTVAETVVVGPSTALRFEPIPHGDRWLVWWHAAEAQPGCWLTCDGYVVRPARDAWDTRWRVALSGVLPRDPIPGQWRDVMVVDARKRYAQGVCDTDPDSVSVWCIGGGDSSVVVEPGKCYKMAHRRADPSPKHWCSRHVSQGCGWYRRGCNLWDAFRCPHPPGSAAWLAEARRYAHRATSPWQYSGWRVMGMEPIVGIWHSASVALMATTPTHLCARPPNLSPSCCTPRLVQHVARRCAHWEPDARRPAWWALMATSWQRAVIKAHAHIRNTFAAWNTAVMNARRSVAHEHSAAAGRQALAVAARMLKAPALARKAMFAAWKQPWPSLFHHVAGMPVQDWDRLWKQVRPPRPDGEDDPP